MSSKNGRGPDFGGACVEGHEAGRCQSAISHPAASCERCPLTRGSSEGVGTAALGICGSTVPGNIDL